MGWYKGQNKIKNEFIAIVEIKFKIKSIGVNLALKISKCKFSMYSKNR